MSAPNTRTIRRVEISAHGGPEVMSVISTPLAGPAAHEVMVELSAVGVNLIDTYHRKGVYPISLPSGLGCEGAGRVVATGDAVTEFSMGDRVAFVMAMGSYAEAINLPATSLVKIPDGVSDDQAAAILLKAMTVDYLFNESFPLKGGETILFHAAAGGVGLVACQWAHHLGVRLIGTASTDEKMALARDNGAAECVSSVSKNLGEELRLWRPMPASLSSMIVSDRRPIVSASACWHRLDILSALAMLRAPLKAFRLGSWRQRDRSISPGPPWRPISPVRAGWRGRRRGCLS